MAEGFFQISGRNRFYTTKPPSKFIYDFSDWFLYVEENISESVYMGTNE